MKAIQIDREVLYSLYNGCQESMYEVFSEFSRGYSELRQNLFTAFDSGNLSSLKRLLHFHGPSFMYLGIPVVAGMFKDMEQKCFRDGNHFSLAADFKLLMARVEESWQVLETEIGCFSKAG